MFRPLSVCIGLRYTRAKRRNHFVSFISLISMLGIALGIIVLITVLSVLNGFDREIKSQIFSMTPPITVSSSFGRIENWETLEKNLQMSNDITAVSPFVSGQGMLTDSNLKTQATILIGIIPAKENGTSALSNKMVEGQLSNLIPGHYGIVIGKALAKQLDVKIGDELTVGIVENSSSTSDVTPHFMKFNVVGIFRAGGGGLGFDSKLAYINLNDAQKLFKLNSSITGFHLNIKDTYSAPRIAQTLQSQLSPTIQLWDWTQQLGEFFENLRLTKTIMFFIFVLIIAVAVFNLICTMVMVVKSKQADIAILRTLGATPTTILTIFVVQGITIGICGTILGIVGGVALAYNITTISQWIQSAFHVQLISADVYFVNYLPSELQWPDVWIISLLALTLSLLATLYPAWHASRIAPAEALRYD